MKWPILICLVICGCKAPQMTLVNNTRYALDVTASNQLISTNLPPGQTLTIPYSLWQERSGVAVAAYDQDGNYVGANDWTFYCGHEQVWRVDHLYKTQP